MKKSLKTALFFLIFACISIITCKDPFSSKLPDTLNGDTRLVVGMHDAVSAVRSVGNGKDLQGIQALYLTVLEIVIIDMEGKQTIILDEDRSFDILGISRSDPVVLSDVSVEPGVYRELRLVLKDENTVVIDGETHPIKIPSGEQSGLKLKGPFEIPKGKLFTLMIELDVARSISWNQGQGYRLQPVLNINNGAEVLGIFRGYMAFIDDLRANETLLMLYENNTACFRIDYYPTYTLYADYNYNSITKTLHFTNPYLHTPGLDSLALREVTKKLPNEIIIPIKQWSLDSIIAVDYSGIKVNMYRVDEFDFSEGVTFTEFTLNIDYPDGSKSDKNIITEIRFIDTGMPPVTLISKMNGNRITKTVPINNNSIQGSSTRILITSYLFDTIDNINLEPGIYANYIVPFMMKGAHFSETTNNPWQNPNIFTLIKDTENQEFNILFPQRLNIRMDHNNFTNNNPELTWSHYPNANGYLVAVLVKEDIPSRNNATEGNSDAWALTFYEYTMDTKITIFSERISFTEIYSSKFTLPPQIKKGNVIRVEVYALDNSGIVSTKNRTGVLFMDSLNIVR